MEVEEGEPRSRSTRTLLMSSKEGRASMGMSIDLNTSRLLGVHARLPEREQRTDCWKRPD